MKTQDQLLNQAKVDNLKQRGYVLECRREATCLYCFEWRQYILPQHFTVDEIHYYEHAENPDNDRVLYAVSFSSGERGFVVDTCNVYMDNISLEMIEKFRIKGAQPLYAETVLEHQPNITVPEYY
jgi:hypothetical protein